MTVADEGGTPLTILRQFLPRFQSRLPIVIQAEAAECGLACICMIASFHGRDADLSSLRGRFSTSLRGATLRSLMIIAGELGFATRPIRAEPEVLRRINLPAILHWNMSHFVVLAQMDNEIAVIHDPARGRVRMSIAELSRHFTGVALELSPLDSCPAPSAHPPLRLRDLWRRVSGLKGATAQIFALTLVVQLTAMLGPLFTQVVIDQGLVAQQLDWVVIIAVAFVVATAMGALVEFFRGWTILRIASLSGAQILGNVLHHLVRLPIDYFEKRHIGDLNSRMGSVRSIQQILATAGVAVVVDSLTVLALIAVMFAYSTMLTLIALTILSLYLLSLYLLYPHIKTRMEEELVARAQEQSLMFETIKAIRALKLARNEPEREALWRNAVTRVVNAGLSAGEIDLIRRCLRTILTGVRHGLILAVGAAAVLSGSGLSVGMLVAFLAFSQMTSERAASLLENGMQLQLIRLHLDRLSDIVRAEPEFSAALSLAMPRQNTVKIELRNVGFRYGEFDPWVLKGINLEVHNGEYVAIVGPSGGGKSTLLKLLFGFWQPTEGQILVNDVALGPATLSAWRDSLGVVLQDDQLLSGSIAENISLFDPDVNWQRLDEAA